MVSRHHPGFKTRDDTLSWFKWGGQLGRDLVQLLEADVLGVLVEALPAEVQVVLPGKKIFQR